MSTKITISLPDAQVAAARRAVAEGRAASVSAYVSAALGARSGYEDVAAVLAEMAAQAGPPSEADRVWARQALGLG